MEKKRSISTKDKIIDAAIDLFSENGYVETSIRDIAERVEIKTSSLYYHFESKEAILNYILNKYMTTVGESRNRRFWQEKKEGLLAGQTKLSAREIMDFMFFRFEASVDLQYNKMVKIICSEAIRSDAVRHYFRHQNADSFTYIQSVLDSLLAAGKISPKCDTSKLAGILSSIPFAFMHLASIDMQSISKDDETTDMFSLLEYVLQMVLEDSRE